MVSRVPELTKLLNPASEQTLSVAAYGEQRPVAPNTSRDGRERNRRIDIRFEMYVPESKEALSRLWRVLRTLRSAIHAFDNSSLQVRSARPRHCNVPWRRSNARQKV